MSTGKLLRPVEVDEDEDLVVTTRVKVDDWIKVDQAQKNTKKGEIVAHTRWVENTGTCS